jgi:hypothetical protein
MRCGTRFRRIPSDNATVQRNMMQASSYAHLTYAYMHGV